MPDKKNEENYIKYNFDDEHGKRYILSVKGIHEARKSIREENRAKREVIDHYFTMGIGLIGAIIGLVSIIIDK